MLVIVRGRAKFGDEELRGMRATSPQHRTVLGVDYGRRRTGLAVSSGGIAPQLPILSWLCREPDG